MDYEMEEYKSAIASTEKFYDRFAQYYDEFVPPKELRADRVDALVNYLRKETGISCGSLRFLELGCGTGSYAIPLARGGHHITGVDISSKMRDLAISKLNRNSSIDFEYLRSDWITALETWEDEFDCLLCIGNSLIHNPPCTLPTLFTSALRALKPGGILILNGRRIERELEMSEGRDTSQDEICRSGGPTYIPGAGPRIALRFMFLTKVSRAEERKTVITFYTYDNYEKNGRRFVCHRMLFDDSKPIETKPIQYDTWSTKTYFIYEDQLIRVLEECGFSEVREESPDENYFRLEKNWYIAAQKPRR